MFAFNFASIISVLQVLGTIVPLLLSLGSSVFIYFSSVLSPFLPIL
jgi:hypothetical protein